MNARANKEKGRRFEAEVRDYLKEQFPEWAKGIERNGNTFGKLDRGDIRGIPDWTLECKNEKTLRLGEYQDEVKIEKANNNTRNGAAIVKRRNKPVSEAYVMMTLEQWSQIVTWLSVLDLPPLPEPEPVVPIGGEAWGE